MLKIKRALISVSDKTGLDSLVKTLNKFGVEILSTGGTRKAIEKLSIPVKDVSEYTGFPEMMDGRVKTLHPKIHGGLLALRNNKEHMSCAKKHDISMIDMVVINLYPFEKTIAKKGVKLEDAIENIDIGGPSMLRSAAKNYKSVAILSDPAKYQGIIAELEEQKGELSETTLCNLALDVFKRTSEYDKAIYDYLGEIFSESKSKKDSTFSNILNFNFKKISDLRYGENPHQRAAFYKDSSSMDSGITSAKKLQGKELSFNNILDLTAALDVVRGFDGPAAVVIKHTNPCGAATTDSIGQAYLDALDCDRMSAFGSIVGLNRDVDEKLASLIMEEASFVECLIAPSVSPLAQKVFSKKKNLRILELPGFKKNSEETNEFKKVSGGVLVQNVDSEKINEEKFEVVTKKKLEDDEKKSLLFAWEVVKHVKSNAIVLVSGTKTVGIGAGQMSRVDSVIIACRKAGERTKGAVLASDAFFPMADSIEEAHKKGIKAIIQPGGSIRDGEVVDACNKYGIAMVFTGTRYFKH